MDIINFPNYLIYQDGRVWSKYKNKFLKHLNHNYGYKSISLYEDKKQNKFLIHRLVALHYIPNPNNYPEVDHKNRVKDDNRIENLRWATRSMNNINKGVMKLNTSGHNNITFLKRDNVWRYTLSRDYNCIIQKTFNTLIDAICYKFIFILKLKSNLI